MDNPNAEKIIQKLRAIMHLPEAPYVLASLIRNDLFLDSNKLMSTNWHARASNNEVTFLAGLMVQNPLALDKIPTEAKMNSHLTNVRMLLESLHMQQVKQLGIGIAPEINEDKSTTYTPAEVRLATHGGAQSVHETIFYGASGAYDFQLLNLAGDIYKEDVDWLTQNGIDLGLYVMFAYTLKNLVMKKANTGKASLLDGAASLACMTVTPQELASEAGSIYKDARLTEEAAREFIERFASKPGKVNATYAIPGQYNAVASYPFIELSAGNYFLTSELNLAESIYESPAFWMKQDKSYIDVAMKNRGTNLEVMTAQMAAKVFPKAKVYRSVKIKQGRDTITDIDVLVVFGSKAIVFQCKSKRLNILSRQGDEKSLKDDFKKAIQSAYGQSLVSKHALEDKDAYEFFDENGAAISFSDPINETYLVPVTAEAYPAVLTQAEHYLEKKTSDPWPIPLSILDLEIIVSYLDDPYKLLVYLKLRTLYADKIKSPNEMSLLAYHLRNGLHIDNDTTMVVIDQTVAQYLDADMMFQVGLGDKPTGSDVLINKWKNTEFEALIKQLQDYDGPMIVDIIICLRQLSSDTADEFMRLLSRTIEQTRLDGKAHDFSAVVGSGWGGVTFVCAQTPERMQQVISVLSEKNKYVSKSDNWIGIGLTPDRLVRMVMCDNQDWRRSSASQELVNRLEKNKRKIAHPVEKTKKTNKPSKNLKKMRKKSKRANRKK